MAKVVSVYLSTEEAKELDRLCEEFSVTPYKLLRLAFQALCRETEDRKRSKEPPKKETSDAMPKEKADVKPTNPFDEFFNGLVVDSKKAEEKT